MVAIKNDVSSQGCYRFGLVPFGHEQFQTLKGWIND